MNNIPTPETDAEYKEAKDYDPSAFVEPLAKFLAAERERDEARELAREFRDALVSIEEYWNRDQNETAMADACWHTVNMAQDALAKANAALHVEADHPNEKHCGCVPILRKLLTDARRERDEAREKAERYRLEANAMMLQRDELREALKKCREDSVCYAEHMRRCGYAGAYKESNENADRATRILEEVK